MDGTSDSDLMEQYASGSAEAFDELFRRYEKRAYGYFVRRTRSDARACDLFQDLFLRLHRFRDHFDPAQPFAPWFFRIAHRVWLDDVRRSLRVREVSLPEHTASGAASPERAVIFRDDADQVLAQLSEEQAQVLVASKILGSEYTEIAEALGKSVDAAKQIGSRALRKLRHVEALAP